MQIYNQKNDDDSNSHFSVSLSGAKSNLYVKKKDSVEVT